MKVMSIDRFLGWAFGQEFAHMAIEAQGHSSWDVLAGLVSLGCKVDVSVSPWVSFTADLSGVHSDALAASRALHDVAQRALPGFYAGFDPCGDWDVAAARTQTDAAMATFRERAATIPWPRHIAGLVVRHAVLGSPPDDTCVMPPLKPVVDGQGRARWFVTERRRDSMGRDIDVEVEGWSPKARRARPGAYRRLQFATSPVPDMLGRLDHMVWRATLAAMLELLSRPGSLSAHVLQPVSGAYPAWMRGAKRDDLSGGVLADVENT